MGSAPVALILGDNILFGSELSRTAQEAVAGNEGATVFTYPVKDPSALGVAVLDAEGRPVEVEENPATPKSNLTVTGLYVYDNDVLDIAASLTPSARGQTETTDVKASMFVQIIEHRQGLKIACPERGGLAHGLDRRRRLGGPRRGLRRQRLRRLPDRAARLARASGGLPRMAMGWRQTLRSQEDQTKEIVDIGNVPISRLSPLFFNFRHLFFFSRLRLA